MTPSLSAFGLMIVKSVDGLNSKQKTLPQALIAFCCRIVVFKHLHYLSFYSPVFEELAEYEQVSSTQIQKDLFNRDHLFLLQVDELHRT